MSGISVCHQKLNSFPLGGQSEAMLIYGNYFHTLNGAQNINPLIDASGVHFLKHTLNGANFLNIPLMAPVFET